MAATTPKKKHSRKKSAPVKMVTFEAPMFDGEFTFPDQSQMSQKLIIAMNTGRLEIMRDWLKEHGVSEDDLEAFLELTQDEIREFIEAWSKGKLASAPKSSD